MAAPIRFLTGRQQQQKIGVIGSTEDTKVLEVIGRVGIGTTIFDPSTNLDIRNGAYISGKVGIGTTTPTAKLDVNGDVSIASTVSIGTTIDIIPYNDLGALSFEGSAGQLFSITNDLTSGSIFSVNDVSGIPSIDVDADGTVLIAPYGSTEYVGIGTTNPTQKLDVVGTVKATSFTGDGSGLTNVTAVNTGIGIQSNTTVVGTAQTINFGTNLSATFSDGVATITATSGGGGSTGTATTITLADESTDTECFLIFATDATGDQEPKTGSNLTFNSNTGALTATSFVKESNSGGFLKADGTEDTSTYLTSYTESQTLDDVVGLGSTTAKSIGVGTITATEFVVDGGSSTGFLKADGSIDSTPYSTGTGNLDAIVIKNNGQNVGSGSTFTSLDFYNGIGVSTTPTVGLASIRLEDNISISGIFTATSFESTVSTGTAPFVVASTTKVTNLNADLLDGKSTANGASGNTVVIRNADGGFDASDVNFANVNASGIITATGFATTNGTSSQFLKADGSVDSSTYLTSYTETQTLNDVLGLGNTSSTGLSVGIVTATSFVKESNSGGFLKADGTEDTNTYLTSYTETQTLDDVLGLGNTSDTGLSVGIVTATSFVKDGGTSSQFLKADGSVDSSTYLTSYTETQTLDDVLGLGNTSDTGLSVGIVTATSFVKDGGTSSQFLKADGSVDSSTYLTSYTETQTLDDVLGLGNTSSTGLSVGVATATSFVKSSNSGGFLKADGVEDTNTYLTSYTETQALDDVVGLGSDTTQTITVGTATTGIILRPDGTLNVSGVSTFQGNVYLGDNDNLYFGDGSDLRIYHESSTGDSVIRESGTGNLRIGGANVEITSPAGSETYASFNVNGAVELYYDNSKKFETTGAGVTITGIATATTFYATNGTFAAGTDTATDAGFILEEEGSILTRDGVYLRNLIQKKSDIIIIGQQNTTLTDGIELKPGNAGPVKLHHGGTTDNVKLQTTTSGIEITGTTDTDQLNVSGVSTFQDNVHLGDDDVLKFGDNEDLEIYSNGTNSFIKESGGGNLKILGTNIILKNSGDTKTYADFNNGGSVELYYDNSKKFETTSYGIYVTGAGNTSTIGGAANLVLDPSAVGDNTGTVTILGNLQVEGTQTIINSTTLEVDDKLVSIAKSATNASQADGAGLEINGASATLTYASTGDKWVFNKAPYYNTDRLLTTADEGSGNGLDADTLDTLEASQFLRSDADDITTGQIQITKANNTATGGGQLYLNGATGNRIDFNNNGAAAPSFTTRSAGTKIVLYPNVSASNVDYALGIESFTLWYSIPTATINQKHRWYAGTTQLADLKGSGELVIGSTSLTGTASQKLQVNGGAYVSGSLGIGVTNPEYKVQIEGGIFAGRAVSDIGNLSWTNTGATFSSLGVDHTASRTNVLRLMRDGTAGVVYSGFADFDLERWEDSSVLSRTALHLRLGHGNLQPGTPDANDVMTWRSNGNVGIGITNPESTLHLKKTSGGTNLLLQTAAGLDNSITFREDTQNYFRILHEGSAGTNPNNLFKIQCADDADSVFDVDAITIKQSGDVGIGTDNPSATLDVNGTLNVSGISTFDSAIILKGQTDNADGRGDRSSYWDYDNKVALVLEPAANDGAVAILFPSIGNATSDFAYIVYDEDYGEAGVGAGENGALILGAENDGGGSSDHVRVKARLVVEADQSSSDPAKAFQVKSSNVVDDLFCVERDGNVGIGTDNPTYKLHINDTASTGAGLLVQGGGSGALLAKFERTVGGGGAIGINCSSQDPQIQFTSPGNVFALGVSGNNFEICDNSLLGTNQRFVIDSSGNIGIGTETPLEKLHVKGGNVIVENTAPTADTGPYINFVETGYNDRFGILAEMSGSGDANRLIITANNSGNSPAAGDHLVVIEQGGNIGVGVSEPTAKLSVSVDNSSIPFLVERTDAPAKIEFNFGGGDAAVKYTVNNVASYLMGVDDADADKFKLSYGSSGNATFGTNDLLSITSSGDFGIGTDNPSQKLHVKGTIQIDGTVAAINGNYSRIYQNSSGSVDYGLQLKHYQGDTSDADAAIVIGGDTSAREGNIVFYRDVSGTNTETARFDENGNVGIGTDTPAYKLEVNGSFAATTKSFVIDHPTKEGMKLRYGSLEGPENGIYVRGRLKGNNTIELPEYWTNLVDEDSITVNLTPIGRKAPLHSVVDIADNTVVVESANDVVDCFYTVFGERKDVEKLEVEF